MQRSDTPGEKIQTGGRRVFLSKINGFVSSQKTHTSGTARGHNPKYVDILRQHSINTHLTQSRLRYGRHTYWEGNTTT